MSGETGRLVGWACSVTFCRIGSRRTWRVGDATTAGWIRGGTTVGLTIDSAIHLVFESCVPLAQAPFGDLGGRGRGGGSA